MPILLFIFSLWLTSIIFMFIHFLIRDKMGIKNFWVSFYVWAICLSILYFVYLPKLIFPLRSDNLDNILIGCGCLLGSLLIVITLAHGELENEQCQEKRRKLLKEEKLIKTVIDEALKSIHLSETEVECLQLSAEHAEELNTTIRLSVKNHVESNASLTQLEKWIQEARPIQGLERSHSLTQLERWIQESVVAYLSQEKQQLLKEEELIKTIIDKALKSIRLSEAEIKNLQLSAEHAEELNTTIRLSVKKHVESNASLTQAEEMSKGAVNETSSDQRVVLEAEIQKLDKAIEAYIKAIGDDTAKHRLFVKLSTGAVSKLKSEMDQEAFVAYEARSQLTQKALEALHARLKLTKEAVQAYLKDSYLNLLARTFPNLRQAETDEKVSLFIKFHQIKQVEDFNREQLSLFFGYDSDSLYKIVCERIKKVDLFDIDTMGGQEFEIHLKNCFLNWGYSARLTPSTNDYGVDILVTVEDYKIAVQAKRYKGSVGISAIQEVLGGKAFYQCSHALVITTGTFTKNAINLAEQVGVTLIDRSQLKSFLFMNKSLKPYL